MPLNLVSARAPRRRQPGRLPQVAAASVAVAISSCSLLAPELAVLKVDCPVYPATWSALGTLVLELSYVDASGRVRRLAVEPCSPVEIAVPRGRRTSILATPRYRGRELRPAGAIYPDDLDSEGTGFGLARGHVRLSWPGGWTASVLRHLEVEGWELPFNGELLREGARRLTDPWDLDPHEVARRLAGGKLSHASFAAGSPRRIRLPGPGPWVSESPIASPPQAGPQASSDSVEVELVPGFHEFYATGLELFVALREEGEPILLIKELPDDPTT